MAAVNGRTPSSFGQAFGHPLTVSGGPAAAVGQPAMMRTQGVPTAPGYRDRIPKLNIKLLPAPVAGSA